MGIEISVKSTIDSKWNESLGAFANCKLAWSEANINWKTVFEFILFDPTRLYDNQPNFWTCEQLQVVLDNLIKLKTNPEYYAGYCELDEIKANEPSTVKLIELFTEYVNKKCCLYIN